ncbi:MAG: HD-GYP domain-containing protein [Elusimicrobiota bacterium]
MKRLRVFALLAAFATCWRPAAAAAAFAVEAVLAGPLFPSAPEIWIDSFRPFQLWLGTPDGLRAAALNPALSALRAVDLSVPGGAVAIAPLTARLPDRVLSGLASPAALDPERRTALLGELERARRDAAPEVETRTAQALENLKNAGESASLDQVRSLQRQFQSLSLYGGPVARRYQTVRRMAAERTMADARVAAARLLGDFRAPPAADETPASAPAGTRKMFRPLTPPSSRFYDGGHWSPALIPDRDYAGRLSAAAGLFARADKTSPSRMSAAENAQGALVDTMRAKDSGVYSHMMRVGLLAGLIAWKMGLPMSFAQKTIWAGRAHDIGKREDSILSVVNKKGKLTAEERAVMEGHTTVGADIIAADRGLDGVSKLVAQRVALSHHETVDGMGYPRALVAEEIPLAARIVSLADYYDALMENRPYRAGLTTLEALKIMEGQRAKFDPAVWKAFRALIEERL